MKKLLFISVFFMQGFAIASGMQSNQLTISGVSNLTFPDPNTTAATVEPGVNLSISPNQQYAGSIISSGNSFTFGAELNITTIPTLWAESQLSGEDISWNAANMISNVGGNTVPDGLNFVLKGTLSFNYNGANYQCSNIMFGQGYADKGYPWIMLSNMDNTVSPINNYLKNGTIIVGCSSQFAGFYPYFYFKPGNDNTFVIDGMVNMSGVPTSPPAPAPTPSVDSNQLCFYGDYFQFQGFTQASVYVTPGQAYESTVNVAGNCLTINANRNDSVAVVDWTKTQFQQEYISWVPANMTNTDVTPAADMPTDLNFAAKGNFMFSYGGISYTCANVIFGQGHAFNGENNWWAFSNINVPFTKNKIVELSCINANNQAYAFYLAQDGEFPRFELKASVQTCSTSKCKTPIPLPAPSIPIGG